MSTFKFLLRRSSRGSTHRGSLCLRLIHERKVKVITTDIRLYPHEWDAIHQNLCLDDIRDNRLGYLLSTESKLNQYRQDFNQVAIRLETLGRYSLDDMVSMYRSFHRLDYLTVFIDQQSHDLERLGQHRTARAYRTAGRALINFNKGLDLSLKDIDKHLIKDFEYYLKSEGKAMNTISYYMRMLRAVYWKAVRQEVISAKVDNPFSAVFTGFEQTHKRALDCDKLQSLNNLDFSKLLGRKPEQQIIHSTHDKSLYDSWRYFFFCFHARGMSFVDLAYLRKDNIHQGVITYYRKKTKQKLEITISPMLQRLIDSFSYEVQTSDYVFPIIRDVSKSARRQYESGLRIQNSRLKQLAQLAGIESKLSTHVSRHSWATLGKRQNLSLSVISEALGHSSEKMTSTYLGSFDRTVLDKASESVSRAVTGSIKRHNTNRVYL